MAFRSQQITLAVILVSSSFPVCWNLGIRGIRTVVTVKGKLGTERCPLRGGLRWTSGHKVFCWLASRAGWRSFHDTAKCYEQEEIPGCMVTPAKTVRNLSGKIVGGRKNKS